MPTNVEKLYLLLPRAEQDENGKREFTRELDFSKEGSEQKIENARPIFDDLRHIKSPYELKLLQHAIDIRTEAQMRSMAMRGFERFLLSWDPSGSGRRTVCAH